MAFQKRNIRHVSNEGSNSPTEQIRRSTQRKDRPTRAAYKADHAVDLKTELIVSAEIHWVDVGNPRPLKDTVTEAQVNLQQSQSDVHGQNVVTDKSYNSSPVVETFAKHTPFRTYIPERQLPARQTHCWTDKPETQREAAYANRRRSQGDRGKRLQRQRSEKVERTFAHVCETGGARRTWLRGIEKVTKRYLIAAMSHNIGRMMRELFGMGTPRGLGRAAEAFLRLFQALQIAQIGGWAIWDALTAPESKRGWFGFPATQRAELAHAYTNNLKNGHSSTGC
jgi:transposase